jgi:ribosomal peptide maturation radical SAM protein 1
MNGKRGRFRQKAAKKVAGELEEMYARYPENRVFIIDKVMPTSYQKELLPLLCEKEKTPAVTFEQRPDLSLHELMDLEKAGVNIIKPGIESFSTGLLKLMNKGVAAGQNILLLRNARSLGMLVSWNLLWGFPGDRAAYYRETLNILPLIRHLQPPLVFRHLSLDRFSRYFEQPGDFQIHALRPWAVYNMVYPDWADVEKLAYRFTGDYPSAAHHHPGLIREIARQVEYWDKTWKKTRLEMVPVAGSYIVRDTRGIEGNKESHILDASRAREIMTVGLYEESGNQRWAVEEKLAVVVDSRYVPLITASPRLLSKFEPHAAIT